METNENSVYNNFSEEFLKDEDISNNPIAHCAIQLLKRGDDVYKVLEFTIREFVSRDKKQMEIMSKLIDNCGVPFNIPAV